MSMYVHIRHVDPFLANLAFLCCSYLFFFSFFFNYYINYFLMTGAEEAVKQASYSLHRRQLGGAESSRGSVLDQSGGALSAAHHVLPRCTVRLGSGQLQPAASAN